ncbi:hypothetical protein HDU91_000392 [Kappamyces sp. JEL0680]|nr:hypothetical protein HDU91_000392 [Kappamyces sp. JEL0680]
MNFVKEMKQQQNGDHFVLRIVQQPYHAKAIGDPPYDNPTFLCTTRIISEDGLDRSFVINSDLGYSLEVDPAKDVLSSPRYQENLRGTRQTNAIPLLDPLDNKKKLFFVYTDLSVRVMGDFRIECSVVNIAS